MIRVDQFFNIPWFSAFVVFMSIMLHVGYFRFIGIEFVSFVDAYDIVIFIVFTSPFFAIFYWVLYYLYLQALPAKDESDAFFNVLTINDRYRNYIYAYIKSHFIVYLSVAMAPFAMSILFILLILYYGNASLAYSIVISSIYMFFAAYLLVVANIQSDNGGDVSINTLLWFVFYIALLTQ